jgi:hypothetical protein
VRNQAEPARASQADIFGLSQPDHHNRHLNSPVTVLTGQNKATAGKLGRLNITTVEDFSSSSQSATTSTLHAQAIAPAPGRTTIIGEVWSAGESVLGGRKGWARRSSATRPAACVIWSGPWFAKGCARASASPQRQGHRFPKADQMDTPIRGEFDDDRCGSGCAGVRWSTRGSSRTPSAHSSSRRCAPTRQVTDGCPTPCARLRVAACAAEAMHGAPAGIAGERGGGRPPLRSRGASHRRARCHQAASRVAAPAVRPRRLPQALQGGFIESLPSHSPRRSRGRLTLSLRTSAGTYRWRGYWRVMSAVARPVVAAAALIAAVAGGYQGMRSWRPRRSWRAALQDVHPSPLGIFCGSGPEP